MVPAQVRLPQAAARTQQASPLKNFGADVTVIPSQPPARK
jgi:hypothetical protein